MSEWTYDGVPATAAYVVPEDLPPLSEQVTTTYVTRNGHDMYRRETHWPFSNTSTWLCRTCNWGITSPLSLHGYDHAHSDAIAEEHANGPVLEPITDHPQSPPEAG